MPDTPLTVADVKAELEELRRRIRFTLVHMGDNSQPRKRHDDLWNLHLALGALLSGIERDEIRATINPDHIKHGMDADLETIKRRLGSPE